MGNENHGEAITPDFHKGKAHTIHGDRALRNQKVKKGPGNRNLKGTIVPLTLERFNGSRAIDMSLNEMAVDRIDRPKGEFQMNTVAESKAP